MRNRIGKAVPSFQTFHLTSLRSGFGAIARLSLPFPVCREIKKKRYRCRGSKQGGAKAGSSWEIRRGFEVHTWIRVPAREESIEGDLDNGFGDWGRICNNSVGR